MAGMDNAALTGISCRKSTRQFECGSSCVHRNARRGLLQATDRIQKPEHLLAKLTQNGWRLSRSVIMSNYIAVTASSMKILWAQQSGRAHRLHHWKICLGYDDNAVTCADTTLQWMVVKYRKEPAYKAIFGYSAPPNDASAANHMYIYRATLRMARPHAPSWLVCIRRNFVAPSLLTSAGISLGSHRFHV